MALSYIGQNPGLTTSATLPAFNVGDVAIVHVFRDGSSTAPTTPGGWTVHKTQASSVVAVLVAASRVLQAGDTTTGTWTNATSCVVMVYRGAKVAGGPIGGSAASAAGPSATITYPAVTMTVTDGTSWVIGGAGDAVPAATTETAPTGMTNRASSTDAVDDCAGHDTNGGVASWSSQNASVGTSGTWVAITTELMAEPASSLIANPHLPTQAVNRAGTY